MRVLFPEAIHRRGENEREGGAVQGQTPHLAMLAPKAAAGQLEDAISNPVESPRIPVDVSCPQSIVT